MADKLYLGFDLSTQQLKVIVIDSNLKLVAEARVDFDADLSKYGVHKGVLSLHPDGDIVAPPAMFLEALDIVLQQLKKEAVDLSKVAGISGAGMQHGTVFWSREAEKLLSKLDPAQGLVEQLNPKAFSHPYSPNWQDATTQQQCEEFDKALGGPEQLAQVTGSKAHHRFSGPQIMRFRQNNPEAYAATARISLVSSFLASVLLGKIAPIDLGDVGGMNLSDIESHEWNESLLRLVAEDEDVSELKIKLGPIAVDGGATQGKISKYFTSRYGFSSSCEIIPFTGDNLSTILALPLRASDAIVSLGTSTTFLMSTPQYEPDPSYHFMNHPTTPGLHMFMLCYKNGALARELIRDEINGNENRSWDLFDQEATSTKPLNEENGNLKLGLFFPRPEIVPHVKAGTWRYIYDPSTQKLAETNIDTEAWGGSRTDVRAILESQFLSLRLRSQNLVSSHPDPQNTSKELPPQPRRIYLVGGGSQNPAIAQVCAEVLGGAEGVYKLDIGGNACALGAAYKAVWGCERKAKADSSGKEWETFEELIGSRWDEGKFVKRICTGYREGIWEKFGEALKGFEAMEKLVLQTAGIDA